MYEEVASEEVDIINYKSDVKKLIDALSMAEFRVDGSTDSADCTRGSKHASDCMTSLSLPAGAPLSFDPYAPTSSDSGNPVADAGAESGECPVF